MGWEEAPITFDCAGDRLLGILGTPAGGGGAGRPAVLIVVGGPQYRAGSHRQFVQLARALAGSGHAVLRFDVRGMGDSGGDGQPFDALSDDIAAAIDALLRAAPSSAGVVLFGLCDGASAALMYVDDSRDPRVAGLCLLNPWLRSDQSHARAQVQGYYRARLASPGFWRDALRGAIGLQALRGFLRSLAAGWLRPARQGERARPRDFRLRVLQGWAGFRGPILLALSEADLTAQEFAAVTRSQREWVQAMGRADLHEFRLPGADHTLSETGARQAFEAQVLQWLGSRPALPGRHP